MGLLQNIQRLNAEPLHYIGAGGSGSPIVVASTQCMNRARRNRPEQQLNRFFSTVGFNEKNGIPDGYIAPYSWSWPLNSGLEWMEADLTGTGVITLADLKGLAIMLSSLTGAGEIATSPMGCLAWCLANLGGVGEVSHFSNLQGIAKMNSFLAGAGEITTSPLNILAWCIAHLDGAGEISSTSDLRGTASMTGSLTGQGSLTVVAITCLAWCLANLSGTGEISSSSDLKGTAIMAGSLTGQGSLASSILAKAICAASLIGGGEISPSKLGMLSPMGASLTGAGSLSGVLVGLAQLVASLSGTGTISLASAKAVAAMSSTLSGQGQITSALNCVAWCITSLLGSGTVTGSMRGDAYLSAVITATSALTAEDCARAVWSALAASYNVPLTMGNKLNSAASAGDPWGTALPGFYPPGSAGEIVGSAIKTETDKISDISLDTFVIPDIKTETDKIAGIKTKTDTIPTDFNTIMQVIKAGILYRKVLEKVGSTWFLVIRNETDTADLVRKALKDKTGADITDIDAGILAQELKTTV